MGRSLFTARGLDALLVIATLAVVSLTVMQVAPWDRKVEGAANSDSLEGMLEINNQRVYQRVSKHLPLRTRANDYYGVDECDANPCDENATCTDTDMNTDDSYTCECPMGYSTTDWGVTCVLAPCGNGTSGVAPDCSTCDEEGYNPDRDQKFENGAWGNCYEFITSTGTDSGASDSVILTLDTPIAEFDLEDFTDSLYDALEELGITANNGTVLVTAVNGTDGTVEVTIQFLDGDANANAIALAEEVENNPSLIGGYEVTEIRAPRGPPPAQPAEADDDDDDDDDSNGGVIAAVIIIILLICGGIAVVAFLMFRKSGDVDNAAVAKRPAGGRAGARGEAESEDEDDEYEEESEDEEESDDEEEETSESEDA